MELFEIKKSLKSIHLYSLRNGYNFGAATNALFNVFLLNILWTFRNSAGALLLMIFAIPSSVVFSTAVDRTIGPGDFARSESSGSSYYRGVRDSMMIFTVIGIFESAFMILGGITCCLNN